MPEGDIGASCFFFCRMFFSKINMGYHRIFTDFLYYILVIIQIDSTKCCIYNLMQIKIRKKEGCLT